MTENAVFSQVQTVSLDELRRFAITSGFVSRGSWGRFLERFHLEHGEQKFDVLLPVTTDIADYRARIGDALRDLASATELSVSELITQVQVSNYRPFRIRARPGSDVKSIPFDEGLGVLESSKALIRASAVAALSREYHSVIRGRAPAIADDYMDRVRLGQTEVGSYVFTLLLPLGDPVLGNLPPPDLREHDSVASTLGRGLELAAEMAESNRVPSEERLRDAGLTANFCESLYQIVDWSETVTLELARPKREDKGQTHAYVFTREALSVLERTKQRLAPEEVPKRRTLVGTITRVSEPQIKRRGSFDMRVRLDGRLRTIRIPFDFEDRDTVITAFREKASKALSVSGSLRTERNGRLALDRPSKFQVSKRGPLI